MSAITTATVLAGVTAAAAVGGTAYSIASAAGAPKIPTPQAIPGVPTISNAQQEAENQNETSQRQGSLANLLTPVGQQQTMNTSLKNILGG